MEIRQEEVEKLYNQIGNMTSRELLATFLMMPDGYIKCMKTTIEGAEKILTIKSASQCT